MKKIYAIGKAAEAVGMTAETLRHYDRIGLVKPHEKDGFTHYRYYTDDDVTVLRTVGLLRRMGLPLSEIKALLEREGLDGVVESLRAAEAKAADEIAQIRAAVEGMRKARQVYERQLLAQDCREKLTVFERDCAARVLFVSAGDEEPSVSSLWQYHRAFYAQIPRAQWEEFAFSDDAAVYVDAGERRLCAICARFRPDCAQIKVLPSGKYLCCVCDRETFSAARELLSAELARRGQSFPAQYLALIRVSGILKWDYEIQLCLSGKTK